MGKIFFNQYEALLNSGENVEVLAIGDSWFHYPANNLMSPLHRVLDHATTYVLGDNGERADSLCTGHWMRWLRQMLQDWPSIGLLCISAGGNDFAGLGDLDDKILNPDCTQAANSEACYQAGQPDALFADVEAAYVTMLDAASVIRPGLPVLLHNYDYAIPNGKALPGVRNWLKLPMDNRRVPLAGAPAGGIRRDVVRDLIAGHTMLLSDQEDRYAGGPNVSARLVWSAGTLRDDEWANELHPTSGGFTRVVNECWATPARAALGLP
jgi:hypothetical protein